MQVWLVGRSLATGNEAWAARYDPMGLPASYNGRLFVASTAGLLALDGSSGSVVWQIPMRAADPGAMGRYSFNVAPTFGNTTGQLVASRCMDDTAPALCMYSAFSPPPSGAARAGGGGGALRVALAAAAAALAAAC
jgi:outer membrane protein assembly factor BamB